MSVEKASQKNKAFYPGKRVFLTGHTGFKGAWMTAVLHELGAESTGYALAPEPNSLYEKISGDSFIHSVIADVCDYQRLKKEVCGFKPEIVIHFAAQAIIKTCFDNPRFAYETNVMGTVNLLEAIRACETVKSVLIITTDKVYENKGDGAVYVETDPLGGIDPYSSSKACMELISETWKKSYLQTGERTVGVSTARASNVIGGGDHIESRLIPSILNSFAEGKEVELRNPGQTRPWQSVLDALNGYLTIARLQYENPERYSGAWNIGPSPEGIKSVLDVVIKMKEYYENAAGYVVGEGFKVHESQTLGLDISKSLKKLDWEPELSIDKILYNLVDYFKRRQTKESERDICLGQVRDFFTI
ncbi:MAG: CDP-glucose 4,6-dehydratase [Spirochaetaceae bacterium]|jgi:CDP-glucose 4,6-dehydratase|nr:CDP-glucose 4,6-dehydratase [Spirochaetaceae bacterium]